MDIIYTLLKIFLLLLVVVTVINIINYFIFPETLFFSAEDLSFINLCFIAVGIIIFILFIYEKYNNRRRFSSPSAPLTVMVPCVDECPAPCVDECPVPKFSCPSVPMVPSVPSAPPVPPVIVNPIPATCCKCNGSSVSNKIYNLRKLSNGIYMKI